MGDRAYRKRIAISSLWGLIPGVGLAAYAFVQGVNPFAAVAIVLLSVGGAGAAAGRRIYLNQLLHGRRGDER